MQNKKSCHKIIAMFILTPSKPKQMYWRDHWVYVLQFMLLEPFMCKSTDDEKELVEFQLMLKKHTRENSLCL